MKSTLTLDIRSYTKQDILNNQKIVANSLSNSNCQTHEKNNEFLNNPFEKNQTSIDDRNLKITRGWFDFKAINLSSLLVRLVQYQ